LFQLFENLLNENWTANLYAAKKEKNGVMNCYEEVGEEQ